MKLTATIFSVLTVFSSAFAQAAAPACGPNDQKTLENLLKAKSRAVSNNPGIRLAPASVFARETSPGGEAANNAIRAEALNVQVSTEMARALQSFYQSGGNAGTVSQTLFGNTQKRNSVEIKKRLKSQPNSPPSTQVSCKGGDCLDVAVTTRQIYKVQGRAISDIVDALSTFKLETLSDFTVNYCETGAGCLGKGSSKMRSEESPRPMSLSRPYTVQEITKIPGVVKMATGLRDIDNTSIYEVTPVQVCGETSYLVSGILVQGVSSFDEASFLVLISPLQSNSLVYGFFQAYSATARSRASYMFTSYEGMTRDVIAKEYGTQAKRLGSNEKVDKNGILTR